MSILTQEVISSVVEAVLVNALPTARRIGDPEKKGFHIVVAFVNGKAEGLGFMDCVAYNSPWGDVTNKSHYEGIAFGKARLSWQCEQDTNRILTESPNQCEPGDPKYQGGIFYRGIAVGVSGLEAPLDEMVAMWIATALVAKAQLLRKAVDILPGHFFS